MFVTAYAVVSIMITLYTCKASVQSLILLDTVYKVWLDDFGQIYQLREIYLSIYLPMSKFANNAG